jgi:hypothetical protein
MSKIDSNNMHLSDEQIQDLMIHYARLDRGVDFIVLYKELYKDAEKNEMLRCMYFIRLALRLNPDTRNII